MSISTPIARARGLGAAREGVGHWKMQRLTAIANVILTVWFVIAAMRLSGADYAGVVAWLQGPFNTTCLVLLVLSSFYHAKLGLQVVIEDYVHNEGIKTASLIAISFAAIALAVACIVAILQVSFGGP
ncbi:MAG: succinate dehydrogenase, hydrophobic membrane anchor protein [Geminicoccaceae bacterium]